MSLSWSTRAHRLRALLNLKDTQDEALALDRVLHGRNVIGKTAKTDEIDSLRFQDKDLNVLGTLEFGQFGVIHVVRCKFDNKLYVRKSIEKRFALRNKDQVRPMHERHLLVQSATGSTPTKWTPQLLAAFHTPTHLNFVMEYCDGGNLQDVLDSSPLEGRISEQDALYWAPQVVCAIEWCHRLGWAHRDIKPSNLVISYSPSSKAERPAPMLKLIDFGSSAPAVPGTKILRYEYCTVPCGTCDYISPEILQMHENALVDLELDVSSTEGKEETEREGYGLETDWWSFGAMVYEMVFGVAPFYAADIQKTYVRIINHGNSLKFDSGTVKISRECERLLRGLLTDAQRRLGRRSIDDIKLHPFFTKIEWDHLQNRTPHEGLHVPQFSYSDPNPPDAAPAASQSLAQSTNSNSYSKPWAFSALFQSSVDENSQRDADDIATPRPSSRLLSLSPRNSSERDREETFIGFTWGPQSDAFPPTSTSRPEIIDQKQMARTPRPTKMNTYIGLGTPNPFLDIPERAFSTPLRTPYPAASYQTPFARQTPYNHQTPYNPLTTPYQIHTLPRTSTRRRREVEEEREAMAKLMEIVGASARKRVLDSGKKLKDGATGRGGLNGNGLGVKTSLDWSRKGLELDGSRTKLDFTSASATSDAGYSRPVNARLGSLRPDNGGGTDAGTENESEAGGHPPSPSPSPRPWMGSTVRSETPMLTGTFTASRIGAISPLPPDPQGPKGVPSGKVEDDEGDETEREDESKSIDDSRLLSAVVPKAKKEISMEERHGDLMDEIMALEVRLKALYRQLDGCS